MIVIRIQIDTSEAEKLINFSEKRAKDLRPVWRHARKLLTASFSQNFLTGGALVGGWAPLDSGYAAWKATRFPGAPTLVQDGSLFRSVSTLTDPAVNKINRLSATFGTDAKYAKFHQYGTSKMPQRQIIFEPEGFTRDIAQKALEHITKGAK